MDRTVRAQRSWWRRRSRETFLVANMPHRGRTNLHGEPCLSHGCPDCIVVGKLAREGLEAANPLKHLPLKRNRRTEAGLRQPKRRSNHDARQKVRIDPRAASRDQTGPADSP